MMWEDFLRGNPETTGPVPVEVLVRLGMALGMGFVVAWIYRRTRSAAEITFSFPTTLVLLSVLIAMVTQVIGDNVARAFSLVGALAIVRFRTVVRDTQDTAYVIFAVVVGMSIGAGKPWVAVLGTVVVGLAAWFMATRAVRFATTPPTYRLSLRVDLGVDLNGDLRRELDAVMGDKECVSLGTARQGVALDIIHEGRLSEGVGPDELVRRLNRVEGVQNVQLERRGWNDVR